MPPQNTPPPSPEPQLVLPKEAQGAQEKIKQVNLESDEGKRTLLNRVNQHATQAGLDDAERQNRYFQAIQAAVQTEFQHLTAIGRIPLLSKEQATEQIQANLRAAEIGVNVVLRSGAVVVERSQAETGAKGAEKERKLTPDQERVLKEIVDRTPGPFKGIAEKVTKDFMLNSETADVAANYLEAVKGLDPMALRLLPRFIVAVANGEQPKGIQPQALEKLNKLWDGIGPNGQEYVRRILAGARETTSGDQKEISKEEREDMAKGAEQDLKNFDATKASEIEKTIVLARLQMRGIDISDPDLVLDKSKSPQERFKAFEGTPMERGFYKIMGLLTFIFAHIEKIKQIGKPKEKTGNAPGGKPGEGGKAGPGEGSAGKEGVRKMMKEAPPTTDAETLATRKEGERDASKKKIDGDGTPANRGLRKNLSLAKGAQASCQTDVEELQQRLAVAPEADKPNLNTQLSTTKTRLAVANGDTETLQQQITQEQATLARLEGEVKSVRDTINQTTADKTALEQAIALGRIRMAVPPANPALVGLLGKMKIPVEIGTSKIDLKVDFTDGDARAQFLQLCEQRGIDVSTLNIEIDTANANVIVAKDAQAFIKALNTVMTKAPAAPAGAPAGAPPAPAPPTGPVPAPAPVA